MPPHTALIIEDNALNTEVLSLLLSSQNVTPLAITHTADFEQQIADLPAIPDLIFLDLEIHPTDGFIIHQRLKAIPAVASIPVIAYTVHTSEIEHARRAGFFSFLAKPLSFDRFPAQLAKLLAGQPVWEA